MNFSAENITTGYSSRPVINALSLDIREGELTALVGTNGSGKSTLLKAMARLLKLSMGAVYLDGALIHRTPSAEVARKLAILPQAPSVPPGLTVSELVEQGRFPHAGPLRMLKRQDHASIQEALSLTGMLEYALRPLDSLSGGERQRAWIALALAQSTPLLLLDEPTTFLDVRHQLEVLELLRRLNRERNLTIVAVLHELNLAARFADRIVVMKQGTIVADGKPEQVLIPELLASAFGVKANVIQDPMMGCPICLPYAFVEK